MLKGTPDDLNIKFKSLHFEVNTGNCLEKFPGSDRPTINTLIITLEQRYSRSKLVLLHSHSTLGRSGGLIVLASDQKKRTSIIFRQ